MVRIFNTLGRELQVFNSIKENKVLFYHCGPTVYWTQHIGNMRAVVMGDLIRRSLMYMGYDVKYVRNYTDFGHLTSDGDTGEDKMEKGAKREGISPKEIADKYIKEFEVDVNRLNVLAPTVTARATDYLKQMIEMVKVLLDKEIAYTTADAIYFDVTKYPEYTKLSGQKLDMNIKGEGHGDVIDSNKKNAADFALWFFRTGVHKNALQYWPSPFSSPEVENGYGFPGWHIECSAMANANLGATLDIHMGGVEHIPVHHTNEIAQSESVNNAKYVNYWIHNEHLDVDGTKMSKSLGNVYNLQSLIEKGYSPIALRFFFLQSHYRSKQNFTFEGLNASATALKRLQNLVNGYAKDIESSKVDSKVDQDFRKSFTSALEEDFNIPLALSVVWEVTKSQLTNGDKLATILDFDKVLGLGLDKPISDPQENTQPLEVKILIEERNIARLNKDFKKADEIREKLLKEYNVTVQDK
jgi:cysteinyl-tRNA synthetase